MKKALQNTTSVFILYCLIGIVLYLGGLVASNGRFMSYLLLDGGYFFDDLTRPLSAVYTYDNVYEGGRDMCFPPLAYTFYLLLGRVLGNQGLMTQGDIVGNATAILVCTCLLITNVTLIVACFLYFFKGSRAEKMLLAFILPLSFPLIIAINQGNGILIIVPLVIASVCLRDSQNKVLRELSLIMLAVAAGFKIYPAVLGLLWVKEKRWKETARLIIYGVLLFFGPYIFFEGVRGFRLHMANVIELNGLESLQRLKSQDITAMTVFVLKRFMEEAAAYRIGQVLSYIYFVIVLVIFFVKKVSWKTITLLTSLLIIFVAPSNSYTYTYLLLPLLLFFDETRGKKADKKETAYAVIWGMIFVFWPVVIFRAYLMTPSVYLLFAVILVDVLTDARLGRSD